MISYRDAIESYPLARNLTIAGVAYIALLGAFGTNRAEAQEAPDYSLAYAQELLVDQGLDTGDENLPELTAGVEPEINGELPPRCGNAIFADPPAFAEGIAEETYQWMANGIPIRGRIGKSRNIIIPKRVVGKRLSVEITSVVPGYEPYESKVSLRAKVKRCLRNTD